MILQNVKSAGSVGKLLSVPTNENASETAYPRVHSDYKYLSERFGHNSKDYARQFAHIYAVRLTKMRELLTKRIRKKWGMFLYAEVMAAFSFFVTKVSA